MIGMMTSFCNTLYETLHVFWFELHALSPRFFSGKMQRNKMLLCHKFNQVRITELEEQY